MGWDSFGLPAENAAIRNDEHPATYTYGQHRHVRSSRSAGTRVASTGRARFNTSDPEYYRWTQWLFLKFRERGLAYRKNSPGQLVPQRPDRAGQRAGRRRPLRALRRRGHQARADPVVLQDHRLRPGAAGRPGRAGGRPGPTGCVTAQRNWIGRSEGAHVDFAVAGREEPHRRVYTTRPDTLFGATFMVVAADAALADEIWCTDEQRAGAGGLPGGGPQGVRHRPAGHRPPQDRRRPGRHRDQPGHRRADPGLGGRLRAGRLRHRRDHGRARRTTSATWDFATGYRPADRAHRVSRHRGAPTRRRPTSPTTGDGVYVNSGPLDGTDRQGRRGVARHHRAAWSGDGRGRGAVNFRLRDWLLSRQRYWGAPDPDHPLPGRRRGRRSPRTSCPSRCPSCAAPT